MSDLVEFLRARLDEDEQVAQIVAPHWPPPSLAVLDNPTRSALYPLTVTQAAHVARHDPARVLREVERDRRILEEHVEMGIEGECARCVVWGEDQEGDLCADPCGYPCRTLRLLALPYADHADYQQEWRP